MDPYRSAPPQTRGPELDRLPVFVRGGLIRGGTLVVTPTELLFEPRFGVVRAVPIDAGLAGLRMSRLLDDDVHQTRHDASTYETVYTWRQVVACGSRTLARALRWLPGQVLRQAIDRVRQKHEVDRVFVLTREEMRAARPLAVEGARYRIVGTQADNQVALSLTAAETATLDAWLSR